MRVCSEPGCPELTTTGTCPAHTRQPWAGSTRRRRLPADWPRTRQRILTRDRHTCQSCGAPANQVDHITHGDDHSDANLQALCEPCHRTKSASEGGRAHRR